MARGSRVDFPGAVHHVYARGIEKRKIFLDDKDRRVFLERVGHNVERWKNRCLAWALMENHFHLLVKSDEGCLPSFMRCLLTAYSMYFNERHERVGHLFQNRYMSRVITKESYLREAIRYIHLNPIRAGLIHSLEELDVYPWTGHSQIMERGGAGWMDTVMMRELYHSPENDKWKTSYRDFISAGYAVCGAGSGRSGDIDPIIMEGEYASHCAPWKNMKPPEIFWEILARVSLQTGIPTEQITRGGRKHFEVDARRSVLVACMACLDVSAAMVARWLGISEACGNYLLRTKKSNGKNI